MKGVRTTRAEPATMAPGISHASASACVAAPRLPVRLRVELITYGIDVIGVC